MSESGNPFPSGSFTQEQKEFLQGFMAGLQQKGGFAFTTAPGNHESPVNAGTAEPSAPEEKTVHGVPFSDLAREEVIKAEEHPFDIWSRMEANARAKKFPEGPDVFRYKFHGLFYVAPAQDSFMLRCRIPGGILTSVQMRGLADLTDTYATGEAALTTRANVQIREIPAGHALDIITGLDDLGLTARGSGADNIRNITLSPTSGIDVLELIDARPLARKMHHRILNDRTLYDLPRKFNIAFDTAGTISALADTNDIGLYPVEVKNEMALPSGETLPAGIYFRVLLGGVTGHQTFARDMGLWILPADAVEICVSILRVFQEHGCRTNRKKARLKYLLDDWGIEKFSDEVVKIHPSALYRGALPELAIGKNAVRRAHIGVHPQKQAGLVYAGVAVPVGKMTSSGMRKIADLADSFGSGELRLTVWQNLLIPNIPEERVNDFRTAVQAAGFSIEPTALAGGLIACTGNRGCRLASSDTKGHALAAMAHLEKKISLKHPLNIHLTGCPNSCAQHYIGDIGLIGAKVGEAGIEGYHMVLGGGAEADQRVGREIYKNIPHTELPHLLERILSVYQKETGENEDFASFVKTREIAELQRIFSRETIPQAAI